MKELIAYCCRSGVIKFGYELPAGTLEIIRGKVSRVRKNIEPAARLAYDNRTLLCPGIPEADTEEEALAAFDKFRTWIRGNWEKEEKLDAWNASHPKGTQVIVHSTVGDRACQVHGRTTTKARLSFGKIVVRVQASGENNWTDINVLTFPGSSEEKSS